MRTARLSAAAPALHRSSRSARQSRQTGSALLAVAHGSADPRAAAANAALMRAVAAALPGTAVRLAYLDHSAPTLPAALDALTAQGVQAVTVLPLLLTIGYHARTDIPGMLRHAPLPTTVGRVLGPDPLLAAALEDRLAEAGVPPDAPVVLAAAGSSDPDAARDVQTMAALLAARRHAPVLPAYASAIRPTVPQVLAELDEGAAVASYFLAPGRLPARVSRQAGTRTVTAPLGEHPALVATVVARYREAGGG